MVPSTAGQGISVVPRLGNSLRPGVIYEMKTEATRDGGFLVKDLARYLKVSVPRCLQMIEVAGVRLRIYWWDGNEVIYGSLSPEEARQVIHRFRLRKGMRLEL